MTAGSTSWWIAGLWVVSAVGHAETAAPKSGERERIERERAAVEALYAERSAACQSRFAVTDCVDDAKRQRREALAPLRLQANALDDAQRTQRAARRLAEVRDKVSAAEAQQREIVVREAPGGSRKVAAPPVEDAASAAPREVKQRPAPKPGSTRTPRPAPTAAERRAAEAGSEARAEARKEAAAVHREAVEKRNAERAPRGKRAPPLPVPASGAAP